MMNALQCVVLIATGINVYVSIVGHSCADNVEISGGIIIMVTTFSRTHSNVDSLFATEPRFHHEISCECSFHLVTKFLRMTNNLMVMMMPSSTTSNQFVNKLKSKHTSLCK